MKKQVKINETSNINSSKSKFAKNIIWILLCLITVLILSSFFIYKDLTNKTSSIRSPNIDLSHNKIAEIKSPKMISNNITTESVNTRATNQDQSCKALLGFIKGKSLVRFYSN